MQESGSVWSYLPQSASRPGTLLTFSRSILATLESDLANHESRKALLQDNVTMVHSGVASFTETGCTSEDGTSYSGEVIICATGFDTSYIPHYPIIGPNGCNMQDEWAKCLTSYMGVAAAEFPNMFTFLGPYSPVSNGPTLIAIGM